MNFLLTLHSVVRWVVIVAAVVAAVACLRTWLRNVQSGQTDRKAMAAFTGVLDLQLLLGLILIFWMGFYVGGKFAVYRVEHATTMVVAVVLAHLAAMWKKKAPAVRARNSFFIIIAVLLLIIAGVSRLPGGWRLM